ncbi:hypothetical protein HaLaN_21809 [Haematococcus lacustris]|uniref:Uncharacterized protein n=1 Tax=Haematococcus lacustris TaxID=44745 RepID=A0A699ZZ89_HAELA|nr:hypothetical protein HaLaN_21809 [Haematococcus lacustris]
MMLGGLRLALRIQPSLPVLCSPVQPLLGLGQPVDHQLAAQLGRSLACTPAGASVPQLSQGAASSAPLLHLPPAAHQGAHAACPHARKARLALDMTTNRRVDY